MLCMALNRLQNISRNKCRLLSGCMGNDCLDLIKMNININIKQSSSQAQADAIYNSYSYYGRLVA